MKAGFPDPSRSQPAYLVGPWAKTIGLMTINKKFVNPSLWNALRKSSLPI